MNYMYMSNHVILQVRTFLVIYDPIDCMKVNLSGVLLICEREPKFVLDVFY
jgi:hypothetical protein